MIAADSVEIESDTIGMTKIVRNKMDVYCIAFIRISFIFVDLIGNFGLAFFT